MMGMVEIVSIHKKMSGKDRASIQQGCIVDIIRKEDQRTGKRTRGTVCEVLTGSAFHPHGIKVRLQDGTVGRVAEVIGKSGASEGGSGL